MSEFILWWGIGGLLLILAYRNSRYHRVEEVSFVMSKRMIDIYRSKKGFTDEQILKVVKVQGIFFFLLGETNATVDFGFNPVSETEPVTSSLGQFPHSFPHVQLILNLFMHHLQLLEVVSLH